MTALIIHGHFYQPPRENPWTGIVEEQPSAHPYHDWNERIHAECYGPNASCNLGPHDDGSAWIVNNYENIGFNFGPTLLSWLAAQQPQTYERILAADKKSAEQQNGHGNAIAQAYGHAIMPLCNARDQLTHVHWGLADFRYRFGREPEAMWLPETACDDRTLELLIDQGLRYVILAPNQAERIRTPEGNWHDVSDSNIDTGRAYRYLHQHKPEQSIAVFFYDGAASRAIAFEKVLASSHQLVSMLQGSAAHDMVNVATDGETYGHHFKFGDLALAYALEKEAQEQGLSVTNYGRFLDESPPTFEVEIKKGPNGEGTSWSCAHGVGRWERDCGCHTGGEPGWNQQWRGPLRAALDFLRDHVADQFEGAAGDLLVDPWGARNDCIELVLDARRSREEFLWRHAVRDLSRQEQIRALTLLELQRNALLMFTSCGWFFSEVSGIETVQILKYAARVIDLVDELGLPSPRERFIKMMAEVRSNIREYGNGANIFQRLAEPAAVLARREA